jgi:tRNA pseudouridine(38-40) synthase
MALENLQLRSLIKKSGELELSLVKLPVADPAPDEIVVRIEADHFLWRMVRRLVGALVRVGSGDLSLDQFAALLRPDTQPARAHEVADWTAPACGLYLERVLYPGDLAIELRGDVHLAGYPL